MNRIKPLRLLLSVLMLCMITISLYGRAGGGGGGESGGGGGSSNSSGDSYSGGGSYDGGGSGGGGAPLTPEGVIFVIIVVAIVLISKSVFKNSFEQTDAEQNGPVEEVYPFSEELDEGKVTSAFLAIQKAWQNKDLSKVRKWISDGVYQRFITQFAMMDRLYQVNSLSNIRVNYIKPQKPETDGSYSLITMAVNFTIDDEFISEKYPAFNEYFRNDTATEYWTFIKSGNSNYKNLYNNKNCPNCGAPFEYNMGEISRCSGCGTLTNNASYDWVLCEITQKSDYAAGIGMNLDKPHLLSTLRKDTRFSVQRMEDIGSNVFMQVMRALIENNAKNLTRFADEKTVKKIMSYNTGKHLAFNRLYTNKVTSTGINERNGIFNYSIFVAATFQLVQIGDDVEFIDEETKVRGFSLTLSRKASLLEKPLKETVYSYECPCCAAPYTDTTESICNYCQAPVVSPDNSWVLTDISIPGDVMPRQVNKKVKAEDL